MATTTLPFQKEIKQTADEAVTLARTTADSVQKTVGDVTTDVKETTEKVFLAGLGALALAEEESSKLFKKLVKKGEKVDFKVGAPQLKQLRAQLESGVEKATDAVKGRAKDATYMASEATDKVEDNVQDAVATVMKRLGVPTREEISELTASVERLTKHIDTLKKERAAQPEVSFTMEAVGGGWYELKVDGIVVDKVQGKEEAETALTRLAAQQ